MTVAAPARAAARSWRRALGLAALTVWPPVLLPVVFGVLSDCGHCLQTFLRCAPMVPGALLPVLLQVPSPWFYVVGALLTLAGFGMLAIVLRELPRPWSVGIQVAVAIGVGAEAWGFAWMLRM